MSRRFSHLRPALGAGLPGSTYGLLIGRFQFDSHVPLRGGRNTGRHLFLNIKVPDGPDAGVFEVAVNIRSDETSEVLHAHRLEVLDPGDLPPFGFVAGGKLAYGSIDSPDPDFLGLTDADFDAIVHDDLYNRI